MAAESPLPLDVPIRCWRRARLLLYRHRCLVKPDAGARDTDEGGVGPVVCLQIEVDEVVPAVSGHDGEAVVGQPQDLSFEDFAEFLLSDGWGYGRFGHGIHPFQGCGFLEPLCSPVGG
jgi:hypothetical protein